jgi:hypothetical protein
MGKEYEEEGNRSQDIFDEYKINKYKKYVTVHC